MTLRSVTVLHPALIAAGLAVSMLAACTRVPPPSDRIAVIASFYPLAEFARRIGGNRLDVHTLVPPGVEPHDYEPSPRDVATLEHVRLLVYNGAGFEPWVNRLLPGLPPSVGQVNATAGIELLTPEWASSGPDPHVWLDPVRAEQQVDGILSGLLQVDPAGRSTYEANAGALRSALQDLHRRFEQGLGACRRKEFVTVHAAFGYLAARYGLRQLAVGGFDPESEPSPARLRLIIEFMRRSGAEVIYREPLISARTADTLARETGARVAELAHVCVDYGTERVLDEVALQIRAGDFLGVIGPNGSGKTTLLRVLLGLIRPSCGHVRLFGTDVRAFRDWRRVGYVPQKALFESRFPASAFEVVASGRSGLTGLGRRLGPTDRQAVVEALGTVGLADLRDRLIGRLSQGQQQRVLIARALVHAPELVLLDEPTVGVDPEAQEQFYALLRYLNRELRTTLVLVSHDVSVIAGEVTQLACLNRTLVFHGDPEEAIRSGILERLYRPDSLVVSHRH